MLRDSLIEGVDPVEDGDDSVYDDNITTHCFGRPPIGGADPIVALASEEDPCRALAQDSHTFVKDKRLCFLMRALSLLQLVTASDQSASTKPMPTCCQLFSGLSFWGYSIGIVVGTLGAILSVLGIVAQGQVGSRSCALILRQNLCTEPCRSTSTAVLSLCRCILCFLWLFLVNSHALQRWFCVVLVLCCALRAWPLPDGLLC